MNRKILVLGSNSFAGSSFIDHALAKSENVIGISRSQEKDSVFLPYADNPNINNFTFYQANLNTHFDKILEIIAREKPSIIVDFAGQGMVSESWKDPVLWYKTNFLSKTRLHEYLRKCAFLDQYIRISTPEVYGNMSQYQTENYNYFPTTPYAISHAAVDMSLSAMYNQYQFPINIGRFANFYGPSQQNYRIIPKTILSILSGTTIELHGSGISRRSFIYADDVSSGIEAMIANSNPGEIYHFSPTNELSIRDLVHIICKEMGVNFDKHISIRPERPSKDLAYRMDSSRAISELGWKPQVDLLSGLRKTIDFITLNQKKLLEYPVQYMHEE